MITSQPRLTALILLCLAALALAGCGESYSWKQKITVSVETPQGPVSASSVQQVSGTYHEGGTIGGTEVTYSQAGEAVVLQVGPGRYLFALLTAPEFARAVLKDALPGRRMDYMRALSRADDLQATVRPQNYPLLVTFDDINDPASVKRVDPDDLDAAFGCGSSVSRAVPAAPGPQKTSGQTARPDRPAASSAAEVPPSPSNIGAEQAGQGDAPAPRSEGERTVARTGERKTDQCYTLKSITLEITDEPVTTGKVEEVLGWLSDIWPNRLDGDRFGNADAANRFANSLSANSFSTEIKK